MGQNGCTGRARPVDTGPPPPTRPRPPTLAMVRVKDEARFLPEWLAHHISLGVEHAVIYDNNSTDDPAAPWRRSSTEGSRPSCDGPPSRLRRPPTWTSSSGSARRPSGRRSSTPTSSSWRRSPGARRVLGEARCRPAGGEPALPRQLGHESIPDGLVTEQFVAAAGLDHHVKVIARPGRSPAYRNSHNFYYRRGHLARARPTGVGCSVRSPHRHRAPRSCSTTTCIAVVRTTSARRGRLRRRPGAQDRPAGSTGPSASSTRHNDVVAGGRNRLATRRLAAGRPGYVRAGPSGRLAPGLSAARARRQPRRP